MELVTIDIGFNLVLAGSENGDGLWRVVVVNLHIVVEVNVFDIFHFLHQMARDRVGFISWQVLTVRLVLAQLYFLVLDILHSSQFIGPHTREIDWLIVILTNVLAIGWITFAHWPVGKHNRGFSWASSTTNPRRRQ